MRRDSFLQISLTTKCNLSCWHCPAKDWRGTTPKYPLNNDELIPWLKEWVNPNRFVIELTGSGDPSMYEGIEELCDWLSMNKYRVLIKTNGLLEIKPHEGITRVAAFHQLHNPPKYFDKILIVDKLQREEKESICNANGWGYKVIGYNKEVLGDNNHGFKYMGFLNNAGHQYMCPARHPVQNEVNGVDYNRITHRQLVMYNACDECKLMHDAWIFI